MIKSFQCRPCMLAAMVLAAAMRVAPAADALAVGDSMMKAVGRAIRRQYQQAGVSVEVFTSIGTGLARLDVLNWHSQASTLMTAHSASTVFVMMGANDNQAMQTPTGVLPFGTPGWEAEYIQRAGALMDILIRHGARRVVWIGLPSMREAGLDRDVRLIESLVARAASSRPSVMLLPTVGVLSPEDGYKAYIIQENGMPLDVRAEDGIHLNRKGAEFLAQWLFKRIPAHSE